MNESGSDKKILIDEDWKTRVEKERAQETAEGASPQPGASEEPALPPATLASLIQMIALQTLDALGVLVAREGEPAKAPRPDVARHLIDMLEMLDAKTKGNRTTEESGFLERTLYELRMAFVSIVGK